MMVETVSPYLLSLFLLRLRGNLVILWFRVFWESMLVTEVVEAPMLRWLLTLGLFLDFPHPLH